MRELIVYNQAQFLKPICALDGEILYRDQIDEIKNLTLSNYSTNREAYESLMEVVKIFRNFPLKPHSSRDYQEHQSEFVNQVVSKLLVNAMTFQTAKIVILQVICEILGDWMDQKIKK